MAAVRRLRWRSRAAWRRGRVLVGLAAVGCEGRLWVARRGRHGGIGCRTRLQPASPQAAPAAESANSRAMNARRSSVLDMVSLLADSKSLCRSGYARHPDAYAASYLGNGVGYAPYAYHRVCRSMPEPQRHDVGQLARLASTGGMNVDRPSSELSDRGRSTCAQVSRMITWDRDTEPAHRGRLRADRPSAGMWRPIGWAIGWRISPSGSLT